MPSASISISEPASSSVARITYELKLTTANGEPIEGEELTVVLEGDGSLQTGFSSKQVLRTTDADGVERVSWFRRGIYGRNVKATLSVTTTREDAQVFLAQVPDESTESSWISWTPRRPIRR
jgi:hypothetical protein